VLDLQKSAKDSADTVSDWRNTSNQRIHSRRNDFPRLIIEPPMDNDKQGFRRGMRIFLTASKQLMKYLRHIYAPPVMLNHRKHSG
jgi:hypothetical protein